MSSFFELYTPSVDEAAVEEGSCRYCECTHDNACILAMGDGGGATPCSWYRKPDHHGLGVCSNPECVKKYLADPSAP